MDFTRLCELLESQQFRYPQKVAAAGRVDEKWQTWTTAELLAERDQLSAELLHLGLMPGDRVIILAHCGSPEWRIPPCYRLVLFRCRFIPLPVWMR